MKKIIIATVIITVLAGFYIFDKVESVRANPSRIVMPITCSTQGTGASSLSTTTGYTFITAGKATTTATCNTQLGGLGADVLDETSLLVNLTSSSSLARTIIYIEYSHDGIDWYQDAGTYVDGYATTSKPFDLTANSLTLQMASTTAGQGAYNNALVATTTRIVKLKTPTKWIRAVFTNPPGGTTFAIWGAFVNKAQRP